MKCFFPDVLGTFYRQIIQLAKHWGIKTINVVRRPEQIEELRLLGADEVICSTTEGETSEINVLLIVWIRRHI